MREPDERGGVELDLVLEGLGVRLVQRREVAKAGVVDEHVDVEVATAQLRGQSVDRLGLCQVRRDDFAATPNEALSSVASAPSLSAERATSTTSAPRRASSRANTAPIPDEAPVMSARCPVKSTANRLSLNGP